MASLLVRKKGIGTKSKNFKKSANKNGKRKWAKKMGRGEYPMQPYAKAKTRL